MEADGFILVKHSKKNKKKNYSARNLCEEFASSDVFKNSNCGQLDNIPSPVEVEKYCADINIIEQQFFLSSFFSQFCESVLKEHKLVVSKSSPQSNHIKFSSNGAVSKIVCLGLGNFFSSKQSQYQLIFLRFVQ